MSKLLPQKIRVYLINELQVPEDFYNDIEDIDERPRIEFEDGWYLVILRIPIKTDQANLPFSTVPLGIVFKKNIFVSICFHATDLIPDFIRHMRRKAIDKKGSFDIVLRLLLSSSVWYHKYLKMINKQIKLVETKLEKIHSERGPSDPDADRKMPGVFYYLT